MFYTYILYSEERDRYYIGQTQDLSARLTHHRSGDSATTRGASDWRLVFVQTFENRHDAMVLEARIKRDKSRKSIVRFVRDARNEVTRFIVAEGGRTVPAGAAW